MCQLSTRSPVFKDACSTGAAHKGTSVSTHPETNTVTCCASGGRRRRPLARSRQSGGGLKAATLMAFFPSALNASVPPERPQLHRNLVCVCLRCVPLQLSVSDNQSGERRSGSGATGTIHLNQGRLTQTQDSVIQRLGLRA